VELMDALRTRRSVRSYSKREVDEDTIAMLLEAAVLAPSASNSQPWAFGYIRGADRLKSLSDRSKAYLLEKMKTEPNLERMRPRLEDPTVNLLHGAPALVAIYTKSTGGWARTDCAMAAVHLMLAAHVLGLGTCWTGMVQRLFESDELKAELGVPAEYVPVGVLALGYPEGELPPSRGRNAPEVLYRK
jgi:nitroreductase